MTTVFEPIAAGLVVALFNKYVLGKLDQFAACCNVCCKKDDDECTDFSSTSVVADTFIFDRNVQVLSKIGLVNNKALATMTKRLGGADKKKADAATAASSMPRAPTGGRGLLLSIPGRRQGMRLVDEHGTLAAGGTYYCETTGSVAPDRRFEYIQKPTRREARIQTRLLDGSQSTVQSWDGEKRQGRFA